jgi:hypothetical protein
MSGPNVAYVTAEEAERWRVDCAGWYFWDEGYEAHGPYDSEQQADKAFATYCREVLG